MSKTRKSVLLSALVLPGAGQYYLKKYRMAGLLIITSLASVYVIVAEAVKQANIILKDLESSGYAISPERITELATQATNNAGTTATSIAWTLIIICWLVGIIDAYRSGRQADKKAE